MKWKEVAKISSNITELEGVYIEMVLVRKYISKLRLTQLDMWKTRKRRKFKVVKGRGTSIGKLAVEAAYDNNLQGKFGFKKEIVNAHGRVISEISR